MFLFLVTVGFLSYHLFGKELQTGFIICLICLLTSLHVLTSFPLYIVDGVWDLTLSVPERCPFQFCSNDGPSLVFGLFTQFSDSGLMALDLI